MKGAKADGHSSHDPTLPRTYSETTTQRENDTKRQRHKEIETYMIEIYMPKSSNELEYTGY